MLFEDHLKFSFFAYHIQKAEPAAVTPWNIGFTPMFDKKAATAAMRSQEHDGKIQRFTDRHTLFL